MVSYYNLLGSLISNYHRNWKTTFVDTNLFLFGKNYQSKGMNNIMSLLLLLSQLMQFYIKFYIK